MKSKKRRKSIYNKAHTRKDAYPERGEGTHGEAKNTRENIRGKGTYTIQERIYTERGHNKREQTHGKEAYSREDIRGDVSGCTLMGLA